MMDEETAQKTEEMLKGGEKKKETEKKQISRQLYKHSCKIILYY